MSKPTHRWTRLASAQWEDSWKERLRFAGEGNLVFVTRPQSRMLRIEVYCSESDTRRLERAFGGKAGPIPASATLRGIVAPAKPLLIRGRLAILSDPKAWEEWNRLPRKARGLLVPAGMAFGTGSHATTAACLRFLCDLSGSLDKGFRVADLGTGTGILAIAAAALGADTVEAIDNDPHAVRVAKENVRANKLRGIRVSRGDVLEWKPPEPCALITANLFSGLLIPSAPLIAAGLMPGGKLIFSGVLADQLPDVTKALRGAGFGTVQAVQRGKWCAGLTSLRGKR